MTAVTVTASPLRYAQRLVGTCEIAAGELPSSGPPLPSSELTGRRTRTAS